MKLSIHQRLSRRDLLRGLGSAAMALPMLELLKSDAYAQASGKSAKLAVFIYYCNGVYQDAFWPRGSETAFTLSDVLSPLNPFKDKVLLLGPQLDGNNHPVTNTGLTYATTPPQHRAPPVLTANTTNINLSLTKDREQGPNTVNNYTDGTYSVDQLIAERVQGQSAFMSLNFGTHPFGGDTISDWNYHKGIAQRRMWTPDDAWNRVFGDFMAPPAGEPGDTSAAQAELRKHSAVTDFLHARFGALKGRVSHSDQDALDLHLTSLRTIEERRQRFLNDATQGGEGGGSTCVLPNRRSVPTDATSVRTGADTEQLTPLFLDMMVAAFNCNLTKVATLTLTYPGGGGEGGVRMPWLGFTDAIHGVSHHNGQASKIDRYNGMVKWWSSQVAYLMQELAKVPYPEGGTLLDHTMIYWFNRHGEGQSHSNFALPNLILGGTGGYFRMGRFLKLPRTNPTNVLVSLAQAMGLADVDRFGKSSLAASGPLSGLT